MPLTPSLMLPDFIIACKTPSVASEPFALAFCSGLRKYVSAGVNIGFTFGSPCNFISWVDPIAQVIAATKIYNITPAAFAASLASAIDASMHTIYTFGQISLTYTPGLLIGPFTASFSKYNIVPDILAVELATAIARAVGTTIITIFEPKLLNPIPGPFV